MNETALCKAAFTLGYFARAIWEEKITHIHLAEETYGSFHTRQFRPRDFLLRQDRFALVVTLGTRAGLQ